MEKTKSIAIGFTILFLFTLIYGQNLTFDHNGVTREYILHKPDNLPANAPLVFILHGYTGNNEGMVRYGMNTIADENKFAVCYPQGLEDDGGTTHWNAKLKLSSVDDIGFLSELAKHLQTEHNLNPEGTFSTGFSNGGFMSYTLASEAPEIFKAVAPVSGLMSGDTWDEFNSTVPVPILHIHGVADRLVPIDGSMSTNGGWGGGPAVDSIISFWAQFNNCTGKDTATFAPKTTAYYNRKGDNGHEVWLYLVDDMAHEWPTANTNAGVIACEVIWEFFEHCLDNNTIIKEKIKENQKSNVSCNARFSNTHLVIENNNAQQLKYRVVSISGKQVVSCMTNAKIVKVDVGGLSRGMYLLYVEGERFKKVFTFGNIRTLN